MDKKKKDCKYWDKCYQRNAEHCEKYNHPAVTAATARSPRKKSKTPEPVSPGKPDRRSPEKRSPRNDSDGSSDRKKFKKSPARTPTPEKIANRDSSPSHLQVPGSSSRNSPSPNKSPKRSPVRRSVSPKKTAKSPGPTTSPKGNETGSKERDSAKSKSPHSERREIDNSELYNEVMRNLAGAPQYEPDAVRYSQKAEYKELLKEPALFMRHMFLVEMPPDFYKFWEFCETQAKAGQKPQNLLEKLGLMLVGPFDCLAKNFHDVEISEPGEYLRHWRFFYDPPEFQTIFVKQKSEIHYGYWRDDPKDKENLLLARNDAKKGCEFEFVGGNCFETVLYYLDKDADITPFNRQIATSLRKSLEQFAQSNDIPLTALKELKKKRDRKVVCKTFHHAGLVVPFDRKTELGYRGLIDTEAKLKKILARFDLAKGDEKLIASAMEELQPFITAANIAVDECDFGTAIELGIDLFCSGHKEVHGAVNALLVTGYSMVDRPQFIAIMKTHLERRRKGSDLSIFA